ncbi:MAG: hypothetical protein HXS49_04370, partial [Theionarchaea archaeon]|nr:hypothetical protein [Theionarchaea archaeon]
MRKVTTFILAVLLILSIPAALSDNDTLSVDYTFTAESLGSCCGQYTIEGTMLEEVTGAPLIPYYAAAILLPQESELKDIKVKTGAPIIQKGIEIPWGQPPCTYSDTPVLVGKDESIYNSDTDYPNKLFEMVSVDSLRGFQILNIHLYPIQYQPQSGTVKFYETMT